VVAKKVQYIQTYKYREIQQTKSKEKTTKESNGQVFMAKCNYVQNR